MRVKPNIARVAALFGEPGRAARLTVLFDGRALPAGELARMAGIAATAASNHLAKLVEGRLLAVEERRPHLAGPLGTALFHRWLERGWLKRSRIQPRLVEVTVSGRRHLRESLALAFPFQRGA
jgi:DNA-binding transcriptional ArsR family regulator